MARSHKIGSYQVNQAKWLLGLQHQHLPLDRSRHTALQSHDVAAADIGGLTSSKLQRSTCGEQERNATNRNVLRLRGHETGAINRQLILSHRITYQCQHRNRNTRFGTRLHLTSSAQGWKKKETDAKMSTQAPAPTAPQQPLSEPNTIQIPEWDSNAVHTSKDGIATTSQPGAHHGGKAVLQEKFNAVLPRSRSYFGLKRRTFLIVVACAFLALLALIIGLAVGLTKHSKG